MFQLEAEGDQLMDPGREISKSMLLSIQQSPKRLFIVCTIIYALVISHYLS
jgi:hypothetical protein